MNRTIYSHLTTEELMRCAMQSDDPLVAELCDRLATEFYKTHKVPRRRNVRYVGEDTCVAPRS